MTELPTTPSQTVGPFLSIGLDWDRYGRCVVPENSPDGLWIRGEVLDGAGNRVLDAVVESWQADPGGRVDHPDDPRGRAHGWRGFDRSNTRLGEYAPYTLRPGTVPDVDGRPQAPHVDVSVFARGMLHRVMTRLCFPEETSAGTADALLGSVAPERRSTLIATESPGGYRFDVRLQGDRETVFFQV